MRRRHTIGVIEIPAENDWDPNLTEEVCCHSPSDDLLWFGIVTGDRLSKSIDRREAVELSSVLAQVEKIGGRKREVCDIAIAHIAPDEHEPVRICIRQRSNEYCIDDTEYCCAGADSERHGDDGYNREAGALPQGTKGITKVSGNGLHRRFLRRIDTMFSSS